MDILIEFLPKVLCTLIDDYRTKCYDCNTYVIDDYTCNTCKIIRCSYCNYINAGSEICIECQNTDNYNGGDVNHIFCIICGYFAYYGIDKHITYCDDHAPNNVLLFCYDKICKYSYCVGTGIYIDEHEMWYCTKHAKLRNNKLIRYTIIKIEMCK